MQYILIYIYRLKDQIWIITVSNGGADAGEDKQQGGDEFSDISLDRGKAERIIEPSKSYGRHIDQKQKKFNATEKSKRKKLAR